MAKINKKHVIFCVLLFLIASTRILHAQSTSSLFDFSETLTEKIKNISFDFGKNDTVTMGENSLIKLQEPLPAPSQNFALTASAHSGIQSFFKKIYCKSISYIGMMCVEPPVWDFVTQILTEPQTILKNHRTQTNSSELNFQVQSNNANNNPVTISTTVTNAASVNQGISLAYFEQRLAELRLEIVNGFPRKTTYSSDNSDRISSKQIDNIYDDMSDNINDAIDGITDLPGLASLTTSGTATFNGLLNINGELALNGSAGTAGQVLISNGTSSSPTWTTLSVSGSDAGTLDSLDSTDFLQTANNLSDLTSTSNARANLELGSLATLSNLSTFTTDDLTQGSTNLYSQWATSGSDISYLTGNVGIGATTSTAKLGILSTGEMLRLSYDSTNYTSMTVDSAGGLFIRKNTTSSTGLRFGGGNDEIRFRWDGSTSQGSIRHSGAIMAIGSNGGLSFGGSTVYVAASPFMVGTATQFTNTRLSVDTLTTSSIGLVIRGRSSQTADLQQWQDSAGTVLGTFTASGNLGIGTTTPSQKLSVVGSAQFTAVSSGAYAFDLNLTSDGTLTTSASDRRLKENITSLNASSTLEKILLLNPATFDWKSNGAHDIGLIAQEVEEIFPELVFTNKTDGYKGINYSRLPALLISGVQELAHRVDVIWAWFADDKFNVQGDICVDDVCVTKEEFKQILQQGNTIPDNTPGGSGAVPGGSGTSTPPTENSGGGQGETPPVTPPDTTPVTTPPVTTPPDTTPPPTSPDPVPVTSPSETPSATPSTDSGTDSGEGSSDGGGSDSGSL